MSKIIDKSKQAEWNGLVRIRQIVSLEMGCIYRETSADDFGIDGSIEVTIPTTDGRRQTKGGIVNFQSKAGKKYVTGETADKFTTYVSLQDLKYWVSSNVPAIFIVFHPTEERLYYVDIKGYVKRNPNIYQKPHKIVFSKSENVFDKEAYPELCRLAQTALPPVDFTREEHLFSNLFPVTWHTRIFTSAETSFVSREEIFYEFNNNTYAKNIFESVR